MIQCFEPQDNPSELAPHPHRLTLRGSPGGADFPPLCPNCGSSAAHRIEYAKVFRQTDSDGPTRYVVSSVAVPFCDPCIARHRAQEVRATLTSNLISSFATLDMLGDFSGDTASAFEPARFVCSMRNDSFANAFRCSISSASGGQKVPKPWPSAAVRTG